MPLPAFRAGSIRREHVAHQHSVIHGENHFGDLAGPEIIGQVHRFGRTGNQISHPFHRGPGYVPHEIRDARIASRLREKIDNAFETKLLHTVRGIGYVMKPSP